MKNFKRVLSLALVALMVIGGLVIAPVDAKAEGTYTKVTSVDEIKAGGNFVIIAKSGDQYFAMGTADGDFRNHIAVTISSTGQVAPVDENGSVPVWTITKIESTENITLSFKAAQDVTNYATWKSGDKNKLKLTTEKTEAGNAFTVVENDGENADTFTFTNAVDTTRIISHNPSATRFACYTGSQNGNLLVYKYSGNVEVKEDITLSADATPAEIVNAAYQAKADGVKLLGTWTLTGVITAITDAYEGGEDYKNVTVTMKIGDMTDKPIVGYRITVADTSDTAALTDLQNLAVNDTITVEGTLSYHGESVQFVQGSIIKEIEKAQVPTPTPTPDPTPVTPESPIADIIAAAKALESGATLEGTFTFEGKVTKVNTSYSTAYGNATVTIQVGDDTANTIECYRIVGDKINSVVQGDTVTVKGTVKNNSGKVQLVDGTLVARTGELADVPALPADATPAQILAAANALGKYQSLAETVTLTGKIVAIDEAGYSEQYKNITVTIQIGENEADTIVCFRLGAKDKNDEAEVAKVAGLALGNTVTVKGTVTNYNGTVEFSTPTLEAIVTAPNTGDIASNAVVVIFAGLALVAVALVSKRKMA